MTLSNRQGFALAGTIIVLCVLLIFWLENERRQECYERGGAELVSLRDNICIDADGRVLR